MPNIFKRASQPKAEPYVFPNADELIVTKKPEEGPPQETELSPEEVEKAEQEGTPEPEPEETEPEEKLPDPEEEPVSYAQIQAELIVQDAHRQAEEILKKAEADAEINAEAISEEARKQGYDEGYSAGMAKAREDEKIRLEEQVKALGADVQQFLNQASDALDRQLDDNVDELRDLAMAIAEKVVCISLKSSTEVISRMIQTALDKRKHKEWVHIYIAECDAKRMAQIPESLSSTLSALADRVRIIPMSDEESGTCIIEMPDEIIDASSGTQLNNIRNLLMDTPSGGGVGGGIFG